MCERTISAELRLMAIRLSGNPNAVRIASKFVVPLVLGEASSGVGSCQREPATGVYLGWVHSDSSLVVITVPGVRRRGMRELAL